MVEQSFNYFKQKGKDALGLTGFERGGVGHLAFQIIAPLLYRDAINISKKELKDPVPQVLLDILIDSGSLCLVAASVLLDGPAQAALFKLLYNIGASSAPDFLKRKRKS